MSLTANQLRGLDKDQRTIKLKELRETMIAKLTANCGCENEKQAFPLLNNETLLNLLTVNEKQQGSNADATGSGDFDDAENAGGWDRVKDGSQANYENDDDDLDEGEDGAEKETLKTGGAGANDQTRGRVGNRRMTANEANAFSMAIFGKPLGQVREEQRLSGNILRNEKIKIIRRLVGHHPRQVQERIVKNRKLLGKSLSELQEMLDYQQPQAAFNQFDRTSGYPDVHPSELVQPPQPNYIGQGFVPVANNEQVVNDGSNDIDFMVPERNGTVLNFRQMAEERRRNGGREYGGGNDFGGAINTEDGGVNTTGQMM